MGKFSGQESNWHHSSNLSHIVGNVGSLTLCATRKFPQVPVETTSCPELPPLQGPLHVFLVCEYRLYSYVEKYVEKKFVLCYSR